MLQFAIQDIFLFRQEGDVMTISGRVRWQMPLLVAGAVMVSAVVPLNATAEHEIHGSNDFSVTYNDVSGPGRDQSSLTRGTKYLDEMSVFGNGRLGSVDYNWTVGGKATDDRRNDPKNFSLTNLQGRFTDKIHALTIGDTFESFSQYALNTAVKGSSYKYSRGGYVPEISLIYGLAYPRWDNIWGTKTTERQIFGGKIKQALLQDELWIGFSGVQTIDHKGTSSLYDGNVFTGDWEYRPIPGLVIRGESSFSYYGQEQPGVYTETNGYAHKVEAVGDADPSRVSIEYELVSPRYLTLAGSATPDREKVKSKWRYKYAKDLTMNFGFLWFHDNIDGQKTAGRTDRYKPEAGITIKRLFSRQYAVADLSYKLDIATGVTKSTDHFVNLNYRDRFGLFDSDTNFGIIRYDITGSRRSFEYTYNTALSSRHSLGAVVLKPSLYLGGWTANEELAAPQATDQIYEYSAGLGVDIPSVKITSNLKVGENRLVKQVGTDTAKTFANLNIFWRPDFLTRAQGMLYAKASVNDFRYDPNSGSGSQNFRECSVTGGINLQF